MKILKPIINFFIEIYLFFSFSLLPLGLSFLFDFGVDVKLERGFICTSFLVIVIMYNFVCISLVDLICKKIQLT